MSDGTINNFLRETASCDSQTAQERQDINLVAQLGLVPYPDGDAWCVLWGSNPMEGVVAFGKTPIDAIRNFNKAVYTEKLALDRATPTEGEHDDL